MMAKKRHTVEQFIHELREAAVALFKGEALSRVVRRLGIAEQTYYRCRIGGWLLRPLCTHASRWRRVHCCRVPGSGDSVGHRRTLSKVNHPRAKIKRSALGLRIDQAQVLSQNSNHTELNTVQHQDGDDE